MRAALARISVENSQLRKRRTFRRTLVVGLCAFAMFVAFGLDGFVETVIAAGLNPELSNFAQIISHASDWPAVLGTLVCAGLIFWKFHQQAKARFVLILAISAIIAGASATAIRSVTGRTRPDASERQGFYGVWHNKHVLIGRRDYNSFPSGHTATVAGIAGLLLFARRRTALAVFFYVAVLGWARIALNCHHFSDVVTSVILGIAAGWFTWRYIAPKIGSHGAQREVNSDRVTMARLRTAVTER